MLNMNIYTPEELSTLLGSVGSNVCVHRSVVFFNPSQIFLGSNVRIDCFCLLSAGQKGIHVQDNIHIAAATHLFGSGGSITLESFSNISSRVSLFTMSDDYTEGYLTNPTIPMEYKKVEQGDLMIRKHAIIGCGSVVMPGIEIELGGSVGALSFVNKNVSAFTIVAGIPIRKVGERNRRLLDLEAQFLQKALHLQPSLAVV